MPTLPLARYSRAVLAGAIAALTLAGCPGQTPLPTHVAAPRGTLEAVGLGIARGSWDAPGAVGVDANGAVRVLTKGRSNGYARGAFLDVAYQIRRVTESGEMVPAPAETFADANLTPFAIARDDRGGLLIAHGNHQIHRWTLLGQARLVAGGLRGKADGQGPEARFDRPSALAMASDGTIYVADQDQHVLRRISPDGQVTTLSVDAALGELKVTDLAVGPDATLYVADAHGRVLCLKGGAMTVWAGSHAPEDAALVEPQGLAIAADGTVYVTDAVNRIRRIAPDGQVTTVAGGTPKNGYVDGPAASAQFGTLGGIVVDAAGHLLVCDQSNGRIRRVAPDGTVSTYAGQTVSRNGLREDISDLEKPSDLTIGPDGTLHVVTEDGLRTVRPDRSVATVTLGEDAPDDLPSADMVVDAEGTAYLSDPTARVIWRVGPDGRIVAHAGGHALMKQASRHHVELERPSTLALDAEGALLVWDAGARKLVRLAPGAPAAVMAGGLDGVTDMAILPDGALLATISDRQGAEDQVLHLASGSDAPGPWAPAADLEYPQAVATTPDGTIFINEAGGWVRRYDRAGNHAEVVALSQEDPATLRGKGFSV
ncbi:MAG: SMP-30/gluconolactonase/LRE family protein, partial [Candidatus Sericytochromatia bacterium]